MLSMQGAWVQSLVGELGSHMPHNVARETVLGLILTDLPCSVILKSSISVAGRRNNHKQPWDSIPRSILLAPSLLPGVR